MNIDLRDEVLGEWKTNGSTLYYNGYVYLNKEEHDLNVAIKRNEIFRRELPLAFTAIRYGDRVLFERYPRLDYALIIVHYISTYPQLYKQEIMGTFSNFTI